METINRGGVSLYPYQYEAMRRMKNGCILCGGVGSGKSRTSLAYFYTMYGGIIGSIKYTKMKEPADLYIITTARKRDTMEWEQELGAYLLSIHPEQNLYDNKVVVDSWNNIGKYKEVKDAFFIFDEQRVVGRGAWVKAFLKIAKRNRWILLSATPGDTWSDYIPVFLANGLYKNRTDFNEQHVIFSYAMKFPKIDRYVNVKKLEHFRDSLLVTMDFQRKTEAHHLDILTTYDKTKYKELGRSRWNPYLNEPIVNAGELCYLWRRIVNEDESRLRSVLELAEAHPKVIIFYNFDYELALLKQAVYLPGTEVAEWNGHQHQSIPDSERWVYLVQYTSGCEGWNCTLTNVIIFFSQNYSYKVMTQAAGRIDRLNTPFTQLYYYHLKSSAPIDLAIARALRNKKNFNERSYLGKWEVKS